jgi:hypothetical protein
MSLISSQLLVPRRQPPTVTPVSKNPNQPIIPITTPRVPDQVDSQYLTTAHVASFLGVNAALLRLWRQRGLGPAYIRPNGRGKILYGRAAVEAFLRASMVTASRMPRAMRGRLPGGKNRLP